jgi:hypothetical protein
MKHHPVIIITSHPEGMEKAVAHLQVEGYEVKVLDSLSANLIDFFGAISSTDPDSFQPIADATSATSTDTVDDVNGPDDLDDMDSTDPMASPNNDPTSQLDGGSSTSGSNPVFTGTINDEEIEIHEVPGDEIILHPKSVSGSGDKVKFSLSESIEMSLWEEKEDESDETLHEVSVHLVIPELSIDKSVKIKVSEMTMDPPVILMGEEWFAKISSEPGDKK